MKPATFFLDTNSQTPQLLHDMFDEVNYFLNKLCPGSKAVLTPTPGAEVVHLTEDKRHTGASGYHIFMNGVPTAYCSPAAAGRPYGHYSPKFIDNHGVTVHEERFTPGLITTVCHEIAEMLADGNIATYSAPDAKGNAWLVEVCDWVFGEYFATTVGKNVCIFPNVALDAFTDINNKVGPYDLLHKVTAPFQRGPHGYAYYLDKTTGKLTPVTY